MEQKRDTGLDLLRVVALLAFVFAATVTRAYGWFTSYADFCSAQVYLSAFSFGMPAFVMLSGAFLLDPNREFVLRDFLTKKLLRLVLAIALWGAFYGAIGMFMDRTPFSLLEYIKSSFLYRRLICVLLTMLGLYLAVPVLRAVTRDPKAMRWYLLLALVFGSLIPTLSLNGTLAKLKYFTECMNLGMFMGYTGLFVAGSYLRQFPPKKSVRFVIYGLGLVGLVVSFLIYSGIITHHVYYSFYTYRGSDLYQAALVIAVFVCFSNLDRSRSFNAFCARWLEFLSRRVFGAYLCSLGVFKLFSILGLSGGAFLPAFAIPATALCVFVMSMLISSLLHMIPVFNRYVI